MANQSDLTVRQQRNAVEAIQAGSLINLLQKHALNGKKSKMSITRLRAAEILLARAVPTLSSVDQTIHNPDDQLSDSDLKEQLKALMLAHPDIVQEVLGLIAQSGPAPQAVVDGQDVRTQQPESEQPIISEAISK